VDLINLLDLHNLLGGGNSGDQSEEEEEELTDEEYLESSNQIQGRLNNTSNKAAQSVQLCFQGGLNPDTAGGESLQTLSELVNQYEQHDISEYKLDLSLANQSRPATTSCLSLEDGSMDRVASSVDSSVVPSVEELKVQIAWLQGAHNSVYCTGLKLFVV